MERPRSVAMAWFRSADYPEILSAMDDGGRLPADYAVWLRSAEQVEAEVVRSGVTVVRRMIEPQPFATWCAARGLRRDGAARARYANESVEPRGP